MGGCNAGQGADGGPHGTYPVFLQKFIYAPTDISIGNASFFTVDDPTPLATGISVVETINSASTSDSFLVAVKVATPEGVKIYAEAFDRHRRADQCVDVGADGTHVLTATATDEAGNVGTSAAVTYATRTLDGGAREISSYHGDQLFEVITTGTGGNDKFVGGGASETFWFDTAFGRDTVVDFSLHLGGATHDTISLPNTVFANFGQMLSSTTFTASGALITSGANSISLPGVTHDALAANQASFTFRPTA